MRYMLYILGFAATLIAVFARTRKDPEAGGGLSPAGGLALVLALAVMLLSMLGTCQDQKKIQLQTRPPSSAAQTP